MARRTTLVLVLALFALSDCRRAEPEFPSYSPPAGNPALLTAEDIAVYEAVIAAYAEVGQILGTGFAPGVRGSGPLSNEELERLSSEHGIRIRPYTARTSSAGPEPAQWETLRDVAIGALPIAASAVADFNARNRGRASLRHFQPKHLRVVWSENAETLSGLYTLSLPGYSASRNEAVVEVSMVTYALAGGGQFLYLKRIDDSWRVIAKQRSWIS